MMYLWPSQTLADSCRSLHPFSVTMPTDSNPSPNAAKVSVLLDSRAVPAIFPEGVPSTFRRGREGLVRASVKGMTDRLTAQVSCSCVPRGEGTHQCIKLCTPPLPTSPPLPSLPPLPVACAVVLQALPLILDQLMLDSKDVLGALHQLVDARRRKRDLPLEVCGTACTHKDRGE